jgi:Carboxypeptidase regulatory-like domain
MRGVSKFLPVAFFAALLPTATVAQNQSSNPEWIFQAAPGKDGIGIVLLDRNGAVITGASVRIFESAGKVFFSDKTNEYGRVQVSNFPVGTFRVQADANGFKRSETTLEVPRQLGSTVVLTLQVGALINVIVMQGPGLIDDKDLAQSVGPNSLTSLDELRLRRPLTLPLPTPLPPPHHKR